MCYLESHFLFTVLNFSPTGLLVSCVVLTLELFPTPLSHASKDLIDLYHIHLSVFSFTSWTACIKLFLAVRSKDRIYPKALIAYYVHWVSSAILSSVPCPYFFRLHLLLPSAWILSTSSPFSLLIWGHNLLFHHMCFKSFWWGILSKCFWKTNIHTNRIFFVHFLCFQHNVVTFPSSSLTKVNLKKKKNSSFLVLYLDYEITWSQKYFWLLWSLLYMKYTIAVIGMRHKNSTKPGLQTSNNLHMSPSHLVFFNRNLFTAQAESEYFGLDMSQHWLPQLYNYLLLSLTDLRRHTQPRICS